MVITSCDLFWILDIILEIGSTIKKAERSIIIVIDMFYDNVHDLGYYGIYCLGR